MTIWVWAGLGGDYAVERGGGGKYEEDENGLICCVIAIVGMREWMVACV